MGRGFLQERALHHLGTETPHCPKYSLSSPQLQPYSLGDSGGEAWGGSDELSVSLMTLWITAVSRLGGPGTLRGRTRDTVQADPGQRAGEPSATSGGDV